MDHEHHDQPAGAVDPVCGMTVDPGTAAAAGELDGTTYYFCSPHCEALFDADPERYTAVAGG